ncbi:hypothetical protein IB264_34065 [Ensifer sp. ENS11]|nr:hypothetical protein [Ensifer sp. ENS11]
MLRRRFDAFRVPAIAEAEDLFVVGHEIDFESTKTHPAYHLLVSRLHKTALSKLFLEVRPSRLACQINDEINVIGGANILERYGIGDE